MESTLDAACEHLAMMVSPPRHSVEDPEPAVFAPHVLCGTAQHALAVDRLVELGVTAVLNCAPAGAHDCRLMYVQRGIAYCALDGCEDIPGYDLLRLHLAEAMLFVREQTTGSRSGGRVLIHCYAGSNRSATLAIACLLCSTREPLPVLVERCFARRPFILKNASFRRQLVELCDRERIPLVAPPLPEHGHSNGVSAAEPQEQASPDGAAPAADDGAEKEASAAGSATLTAPAACDMPPSCQGASLSRAAVGHATAPPAIDASGPKPGADQGEAGTPSYTLGEMLGQGAFATVYACSHDGVDASLAAKVVLHNKWIWIGGRSCSGSVAVGSIHNEVDALKQVGAHPNIVQFFGLQSEPEREVLLLGRADGGDLAKLASSAPKGMEPSAVLVYMRGLLRALAHCHHRRVVHRDVKLENILLDAHGRAVLSDFGHAAVLTGDGCQCGDGTQRLHDKCGTKPWCAPEIISCGEEGYEGPPVDLWSAGVCMFAMLSGRMPFAIAEAEADPRFARAAHAQATGQSISALLLGWLNAFGRRVHWSHSTTQLLDSLLRIDPLTRSTADDALASAWIREHEGVADEVAGPPPAPNAELAHAMPELKLRGGRGSSLKRGLGGGGDGVGKAPRTCAYGTEQHEERTCIWRGVRTETRADVLRGAAGTHHAAHHPAYGASCWVKRYDVPMNEWLREENEYGAILPTIIIEADRPFKEHADNNNNYRWGDCSLSCVPPEPNGGYPR